MKKIFKRLKRALACYLLLVMTVTNIFGDLQLTLPVHAETKTHTIKIGGANAFSDKRGSGTVSLSRSHSPFGISCLGRPNSHPLWNIRVSGHRVFCTNGDKSLCTGDHVKWSSTKATSYSNKSIAKALTYFYYVKNGNATTKEQGMIQAFIWACGKGANKLTAMSQAASHFSGGTSPQSLYNEINKTAPRGYVCTCRVTSCGSGKSRGSHQVLLGWLGLDQWKEGDLQKEAEIHYSPIAKLKINKKTKSGRTISCAPANFDVYLKQSGNLVNLGQLDTNGGVATGYYNLDPWLHKKATIKSKKYRYAKDWESMSEEARKDAKRKGISYKSKEAAQKAAKDEIQKKKDAQKDKWKKLTFDITVKEKKAPHGFKLSTPVEQTMCLTTNVSKTFTFSDEELLGEIRIKKLDDKNQPIDGSATFRITAASDIHKYTKGIDEIAYHAGDVVKDNITVNGKYNNGEVVIKDLYLGDYYVEEIQAPRGYQLNKTKHRISLSDTVTEGTYTCINYENPHAPNYLTLRKDKEMVGVSNSKTVESGASFSVVRASAVSEQDIAMLNKADSQERKAYLAKLPTDDLFGTLTTDKEGVAECDLLDPKNSQINGNVAKLEDFLIIQTDGEQYFSLAPIISSIDPVIQNEQETLNQPDGSTIDVTHYYLASEHTLLNQAEPPFISIQKKKQTSDGEVPEVGAKFQILNTKDGKPITLTKADGTTIADSTITTGTDGNTELFYLMPGEYMVHQVSGEKGYLLMDDQLITITEKMMEQYKKDKKPIVFDYLNYPGPPKLYLSKKSAETDAPVDNATYRVTDVRGDEVGTFRTGEDGEKGKCMLELPGFGSYVIQEIETPSGFVLDKKQYTFEITEKTCQYTQEGEAFYTVEMTDVPIYGEIALSKNGNKVSAYSSDEKGFVYERANFIPGAVYALYAGEDIKKDNGNLVWSANTEICRLTSDGTKALKFVNPKADLARKMESTDFWLGSYYVKEISAPSGYTLDKERHDLILTDKGLVDTTVDPGVIEDVTGPLGNNGVKITHGRYVLETGEALNARLRDKSVTEIHFVYDVAPAGAVDVSQDKDGSVVMWNTGTKYYISTQTKGQIVEEMVYFNADSSHMFENLYDLEKIDFDSAYTIYMKNASYMFAEDSLLEKLDLSPFNTERLEYAQYMFYNCHSLTQILVFDKSLIVDEEYNPKPVYITAQPNRIFGLPGMEEVDSPQGTTLNKPEPGDPINFDDFTFVVHYEDGTEEQVDIDSCVAMTEKDKKNNPVTPPADIYNPPEMVNYPKATLEHPNSADAGKSSSITTVGKHKIYFRNIRILDPDTGAPIDYRKYCHTEDNILWNDGVECSINVIDPNTVSDDSQVPKAHVDLEMYNSKTSLDIMVHKTDADSGKSLGGAVIGLYANKDIVGSDGTVICKADTLINSATTSDSAYDSGAATISFENLPIIPGESELYYVKEITPPLGYELNTNKFVVNTTADVSNGESVEITQRSVTITNKKTDFVTLYKHWPPDDLIPESEGGTGKAINVKVTVNVLKDGKKIGQVVLSKDNNWREVFDGNGQIPGLVIQNDEVKNGIYDFKEVIPEGNPFYQVGKNDHDGDNNIVTISNKFNVTSATVRKTFMDQDNKDGIRPTSVRVKLLGSNGRTYGIGTLSDANNWSRTINNLPATDANGNKITYHWEEISTTPAVDLTDPINGYIPIYNIDPDDPTLTHLENWHGTTSRSIQKIWDDNSDADKRRPAFVDVNLLADGQPAKDISGKAIPTVRLNNTNRWKATVDNLPIVNSSKQDIVYTWKEVSVAYTDKNTSGDGYSDKTVLHHKDTHFPIMGTENKGYGFYYSMKISTSDPRLTLLTNTKAPDEKGKITISKKVRLDVILNSGIYPTFKFTLNGTTVYGEKVNPITKTISFTKEKMEEIKKNLPAGSSLNQYVTLEATFDNLFYGEYYIKESGMEPAFHLSEITNLVSAEINKDKKEAKFFLDKENPACAATFINEPTLGGFKLSKFDSDGKTPLDGVEFKIESPYGQIYKGITGQGIVGEWSTTGNYTPYDSVKLAQIQKLYPPVKGEISYGNLLPGTYKVIEIKTVKGKSLLTEPFTIKLPLTLTPNQVASSKVDVTKGEQDKDTKLYYFYDLDYEVTNHDVLKMPMTGIKDTLGLYLPVLMATFLITLGGFFLLKRKRKI